MEPRQLLSANPLVLGIVYLEQDVSSDVLPDRFELRFDGGAPGTELVRLVIDGDQDSNGFGRGDVFFDTEPGGLGADHSHPFRVEELITARPDAWVRAHVEDGSTLLVLELFGFQAGDRLVFTIDVDEALEYDPWETDLDWINEGFDPITSGVEFQGTKLTAEFTAPHYQDVVADAVFRNRYNTALHHSGLDLPDYESADRRAAAAGAFLDAEQLFDPAVISGYVYADANNNGVRDEGEIGIGGVTIHIIPVDTIEPQETQIRITNNDGYYEAAGLAPGRYRIVQVDQPEGYLDGLDAAGTVDGVPSGEAINPGDHIENIFLGGGSRGIDYIFGEILPASIAGSVYVTDADGRCFGSGVNSEPLADVRIELWDELGGLVATTHTNLQGRYSFTQLLPGIYTVIEVTPQGLIDAGARAGFVDGIQRGQVVDANTIANIELQPGNAGLDYNFCEHLPATLSGYVYHDRNDNGWREPGEQGIGSVLVTLFDAADRQVAQQRTTANGYYQFIGLSAGVYRLVEAQPDGWLDGQDRAGQVDGRDSGRADAPGDTIRQITLRWGSEGLDYNFGELLPGSIEGRVHADLNMNFVLDDPREWPIADVRIELLNSWGVVVATTWTDAQGRYRFEQLVPGMYSVRETQPEGYFQGSQQAGSHGGDDSVPDLISAIPIGSSQQLVDYNFAELPPSSIGGQVLVRTGPFCQPAAGQPLADVRVDLLDATGTVVGTARTAADGTYQFTQLPHGVYSLRETQPAGYFHGGQSAGSGGGNDRLDDLISSIHIGPGLELVDYNFCEIPPSSISGFVFQDGPTISTFDDQPLENLTQPNNGRRTADSIPIPGVVLELRDGVTGMPIMANQVLPGSYAAGPIYVQTGADGYYEFKGLPIGSYAVYQIHPAGYVDGIDTPGTTGGIAVNVDSEIDPRILRMLTTPPNNDAIIRIPLGAGQSSRENNFSELRVEQVVPHLPPPPPTPPIWNPVSIVLPPAIGWLDSPQMAGTAPSPIPTFGSASGLNMSWHLSVINGGFPRSPDRSPPQDVWRTASYLNHTQWTSFQMNEGRWQWPEDIAQWIGERYADIVFGIRGAIPICGDFNGDGTSQIGMFYQGHWFIDVNGNGRWDEQDLWALLGGEDDLPIVGDWDGDGKDDIGIFGPEWLGDERAIKAEPGLPNPQNKTRPVPKNLPPEPAEATTGHRILKRTASGTPRADVIDHVFRFGISGDIPVAGDWNGDGIDTIGIFRDGIWYLDSDGDGRFTERDEIVHLGQTGDWPLAGDWNGDGIDNLGVFRHGMVYLDTNGDRILDAHDEVFRRGEAGDIPVVGDFDGSGRDDVAIYREAG